MSDNHEVGDTQGAYVIARDSISNPEEAIEAAVPNCSLPPPGELLQVDDAIENAKPTADLLHKPASLKRRKAINQMVPNKLLPSDVPPLDTETAARVSKISRTQLLPISAIKARHRQRQDFLNAEGALTRQLKAILRRKKASARTLPRTHSPSSAASPETEGGQQAKATPDGSASFGLFTYTQPIEDARKLVEHSRKQAEKELVHLAKQLPVYAYFVEPLHGFGALGFAQIIGEAGNLSDYTNPAKLWKRFGLGLVGDIRQQRRTNKAEALEHGYSPRRRAVMFVIGDALLRNKNAYKDLWNARKEYEIAKATAAGLTIRAAKKGDSRNDIVNGYITKKHIQFRCNRYVEKRLLRDLWRAWRDHSTCATQGLPVALSSPP